MNCATRVRTERSWFCGGAREDAQGLYRIYESQVVGGTRKKAALCLHPRDSSHVSLLSTHPSRLPATLTGMRWSIDTLLAVSLHSLAIFTRQSEYCFLKAIVHHSKLRVGNGSDLSEAANPDLPRNAQVTPSYLHPCILTSIRHYPRQKPVF